MSKLNLNLIPCSISQKHPVGGVWGKYQTEKYDGALDRFSQNDGLCVVCGAISDNLECIDFDCAGEAFEPWLSLVSTSPLFPLLSRLYIERSQRGGYHVFYHIDETPSDNTRQHLSYNNAGKCNIETLGEGEIAVTALGGKGREKYRRLEEYASEPPLITLKERNELLRLARSLSVKALQKPVERVSRVATSNYSGGLADALRNDIRPLLNEFQKNGWEIMRLQSSNYKYGLKRPNGNKFDNAFITSDNAVIVRSDDSKVFPFNPQTYSPIEAYTILKKGETVDFSSRGGAVAIAEVEAEENWKALGADETWRSNFLASAKAKKDKVEQEVEQEEVEQEEVEFVPCSFPFASLPDTFKNLIETIRWEKGGTENCEPVIFNTILGVASAGIGRNIGTLSNFNNRTPANVSLQTLVVGDSSAKKSPYYLPVVSHYRELGEKFDMYRETAARLAKEVCAIQAELEKEKEKAKRGKKGKEFETAEMEFDLTRSDDPATCLLGLCTRESQKAQTEYETFLSSNINELREKQGRAPISVNKNLLPTDVDLLYRLCLSKDLVPTLTASDLTPEALEEVACDNYLGTAQTRVYSQLLLDYDEGARLFAGTSYTKTSASAVNGSLINLFNGGAVATKRKLSTSHSSPETFCSASANIQTDVVASMIVRNPALVTQGLLPRFCIAYSPSEDAVTGRKSRPVDVKNNKTWCEFLDFCANLGNEYFKKADVLPVNRNFRLGLTKIDVLETLNFEGEGQEALDECILKLEKIKTQKHVRMHPMRSEILSCLGKSAMLLEKVSAIYHFVEFFEGKNRTEADHVCNPLGLQRTISRDTVERAYQFLLFRNDQMIQFFDLVAEQASRESLKNAMTKKGELELYNEKVTQKEQKKIELVLEAWNASSGGTFQELYNYNSKLRRKDRGFGKKAVVEILTSEGVELPKNF